MDNFDKFSPFLPVFLADVRIKKLHEIEFDIKSMDAGASELRVHREYVQP